jgi:hypothetical protein
MPSRYVPFLVVMRVDPVLSPVEKTPTEPQFEPYFKYAIDLQIRLSSKFVEALETYCQCVCKISSQSESVWFRFAFKN